ncbi:hypothetical protein JVT61DRAFT_1972 [Boletus reticuloceps]|uniref:Uncharacterized protein n=1 Tax=Boletus reticuloceps TaxID=495285 RepID=A0A8I2YBV1_9AGAM|nr:hypothetical protein JVT61DRAFT_1972 [Boletus reticuloceps]
MLKLERCLEEQRRLGTEADNLCRWYGDELAVLELSLHTPRSEFSPIYSHACLKHLLDELYILLLQQCRNHILALEPRWVSPVTSAVRFESRHKEALSLATRLSGGTPQIALLWVNATTVEVPLPVAEDDEVDIPDAPPDSFDHSDATNPILADYLSDHSNEVPEELDEPVSCPHVRIIWEYPLNITIDKTPVPSGNYTNIPRTHVERVYPTQEGFPRMIFEASNLEIL